MLESILIWLGLTGITAIDATGDASKGSWKWTSQFILRVLPIPAMIAQSYLNFSLLEIGGIAGAAVLINAGFFNPIYNLTAKPKRKWYEFGTKKAWDRFNNKLKQRPAALQSVYALAAILGGLSMLGFWEILNK